jgi:uncharacterized protein (TIGR02597 family)
MKSPMRRLNKINLALASFIIIAMPWTSHATSVATSPLGYVRHSIPAATSIVAPRLSTLALPLHSEAVFASAVSGRSVDSIYDTTAFFLSGEFATSEYPYAVSLKSGALEGKFFLIVANTINSLTVDSQGINLSSLVQEGDLYEILPLDTLGSLFGESDVPFKTGTSVSQADILYFRDGNEWGPYFHNGSQWQTIGSDSQNNKVLFPDQAVLVMRRDGDDIDLTLIGAVPTTALQVLVSGRSSTFLANSFPAELLLGETGLETLPNWRTGNDLTTADLVYLLQDGAWKPFFHNGSNWQSIDSSNSDTQSISIGSGLLVMRESVASGPDALLDILQPYAL